MDAKAGRSTSRGTTLGAQVPSLEASTRARVHSARVCARTFRWFIATTTALKAKIRTQPKALQAALTNHQLSDAAAAAPHANFTVDKWSFEGGTQSAQGEDGIAQAIMQGGPVETAFDGPRMTSRPTSPTAPRARMAGTGPPLVTSTARSRPPFLRCLMRHVALLTGPDFGTMPESPAFRREGDPATSARLPSSAFSTVCLLAGSTPA